MPLPQKLIYSEINLIFYEMKENMLPHPIEFIATQRREAALEAAELHRLLKAIRKEQTSRQSITWPIRQWLGARLVVWGCKLQGCRAIAAPTLVEL